MEEIIISSVLPLTYTVLQCTISLIFIILLSSVLAVVVVFKFNKYIRHLPPLVLQCTIDCPVVCRVSFFLFIILGILIKYRKQALGGFRYFIF